MLLPAVLGPGRGGAKGRDQRPGLEAMLKEHAKRRHLADADELGGSVEGDFAALGPFSVAVGGNVMVTAKAVHALLRPPVAVSGRSRISAATIEFSEPAPPVGSIVRRWLASLYGLAGSRS
jgi:hypothetical protein